MYSHEYIIWLSVLAYAIHIVEEYYFDWVEWARSISGIKNIGWSLFYFANSAVLIIGIGTAIIGWRAPVFALIIPALQIINGLFFHILPTFFKKRYSPGFISSILLFLPIGLWAFIGAKQDDVLSLKVGFLSFFLASILMSTPFIILKIAQYSIRPKHF